MAIASFIKNKLLLFCLIGLSACSSIIQVDNPPVKQLPQGEQRYSSLSYVKRKGLGDELLILSFSGGGTRAAALAYGVLEELRDTYYIRQGRRIRLLDEIDKISSVSGGSFTSAYYGLFGERIFSDFKPDFLYRNVQRDLSYSVFGIFNALFHWLTRKSRTDTAIEYYDQHIFKGKTFADLIKADAPMILINASDLNSRSQFIFVQPQFDFLCSDLNQFKISRAVAASSAVPVLFNPVLVKRHDDCHIQKPAWLSDAEKRLKEQPDEHLEQAIDSILFYLDPQNPPYATLVDGGVTDNLGLRTLLRSVNLFGSLRRADERLHIAVPPRAVVIVVDASTRSQTHIGLSNRSPSIRSTLKAVTDMQLHLYNLETQSLIQQKLIEWAKELSSPDRPVKPYFIHLNLTEIKDPKERLFFNRVKTSFYLEKEEVDHLIRLGRQALRQHPQYRAWLAEIGAISPNNPVD